MIRKLFSVIVLLWMMQSANAQDSLKVFKIEDLFWYLENYHPVSKQASLLVRKGENEVRKSKGLLDPQLYSSLSEKQLNQKEYYSLLETGLKIPTWYGIDLNAGYIKNTGVNVNPEEVTTTDGLIIAGVSVPLGQGLIIDKRRAAIKQAKLYAEATLMERELMLNKLYYDASLSYLHWVSYYNQLQLYRNVYELSAERFKGVVQSFKGGDIPAIDTLESFINMQIREAGLNQANLNYQNATLDLSNYLWYETNIPLDFDSSVVPPSMNDLFSEPLLSLDSLNTIIQQLEKNHPQLKWYTNKQDQLKVERRYNAELLKPSLNLKYNFLNEPSGGDAFNGFSESNYSWGVEFNVPLFLREGRGRLSNTRIQLQNVQMETSIKKLEIVNKVKYSYNKQLSLSQQISIVKNTTENYFSLLEAEKQKFILGESSVFLVNSREASYLQAALKLIELNIKYQQSVVDLRIASSIW